MRPWGQLGESICMIKEIDDNFKGVTATSNCP